MKYLNIPSFELSKEIIYKAQDLLIAFNKAWRVVVTMKKENHRVMLFNMKVNRIMDFDDVFIDNRRDYWNKLVDMLDIDDELKAMFESESSLMKNIGEITNEMKEIDSINGYNSFYNKAIGVLSIITDLKLMIELNCKLFEEHPEEDLIFKIENEFYNNAFDIQSLSNEYVLSIENDVFMNRMALQLLMYKQHNIIDFDVFYNKESKTLSVKPLSMLIRRYMRFQDELSTYITKEKMADLSDEDNHQVYLFKNNKEEQEYRHRVQLLWIKYFVESVSSYIKELNETMISISSIKEPFEVLNDKDKLIIYRLASNKTIDAMNYVSEQLKTCEIIINDDEQTFNKEKEIIKIKQAPSYLPDDKRNTINKYVANNIENIREQFQLNDIVKKNDDQLSFETDVFNEEKNKYNQLKERFNRIDELDKLIFMMIRNDSFIEQLNALSLDIISFYKEIDAHNRKLIEGIDDFKEGIDMYNVKSIDSQPFDELVDMLS